MFGLKEREQKTITNFAYIDQSVDSALEKPIILSDAVKEKVRKDAHKTVAGFRVHDPKAEAEALDKMIADRRKSIEGFIKDRKEVRQKIADLGVTCLAVVPKDAWFTICQKTGLIVLAPDKNGAVTISRDAVRARSARDLKWYANHDPVGYIKSLFPNESHQGMTAHVILPQPPQDVAETLLKVQSLGLKVAAVPEAISIRETPEQLWNYQQALAAEEERIAEMIRRDPIVYHEHGSAAAIITQFGDFPIEKEVVDLVVAADDFIPERLKGTESVIYNNYPAGGLTNMSPKQYIFLQQMQAMQRAQQTQLNQMGQQYIDSSMPWLS